MENSEEQPKREFDRELDRLEARISELKTLYEQFFIGIVTQPPNKMHQEVSRTIRSLLQAPFKNSANRFRLRTLIQRFQTYQTYWERVNKQREQGTYRRDVFKAELRQRMNTEAKERALGMNKTETGMKQLYQSYTQALRKNGVSVDSIQFDSFKKTLASRASELQKRHGTKKLSYKVVVKNGKVSLKASAKKE